MRAAFVRPFLRTDLSVASSPVALRSEQPHIRERPLSQRFSPRPKNDLLVVAVQLLPGSRRSVGN
jgi:hypothetical protein